MDTDFVMPSELLVDGKLNIEVELEEFRQQWHDEIDKQQLYQELVPGGNGSGTVGDGKNRPQQSSPRSEEPSAEDQARFLFLQGVGAEQSGRLYDAIQYYRRAVQLVPDIELKIDDFSKPMRRERVREESESSTGLGADEELTDLIEHIINVKLSEDDRAVCRPGFETRMTHMSSLPVEVLTYIFKWVVSTDLDVHSLEQLSGVCRGFYLCARDEELWRLVCLRTWGKNCGRPSSHGTYRNMYIHRPHLRFNGCYISKSTYYREGEKSLDNCYRPFHIVEYFRYIRFFPDGQVVMITTPDNPYATLPSLRSRTCYIQGMLTGFYKLSGDRVTLMLKRKPTKSDYQPWIRRYGRQSMAAQNNNNNINDSEQSFEAELIVKSVGAKPHWQLAWARYSVHTVHRVSREESIVDFELGNSSYPPLMFSRVRSFTAVSDGPLK